MKERTNRSRSTSFLKVIPVCFKKTRKARGALDPAVVPPPPGGVKYVTVTQDKSPCLCRERHDEYLFGRAKFGGLGQVTTKKKGEKPQGH